MADKLHYKKLTKSYNKRTERVLPSQMLFQNHILAGTEDENTTWFNTKKASAYLGITPNALRILVHRGKIEAYKLGSHLRFAPTALQSLLIKKEV
ncbi:MAG: helix-turn-helix domain-containing protein [Bacteriovoracia bacterium]